MSQFFKVAEVCKLPPGGKKIVEVDGFPVAVFNVGGEFYAIEDVCTHDGAPLAEGEVEGDEIECPRHGARFNIRTGEALCMPAVEPIECYKIKVEGDNILVCVD